MSDVDQCITPLEHSRLMSASWKQTLLRALAVALSLMVLTPLAHKALSFGTVDTIGGKPNLLLLVVMLIVQGCFLALVFNAVRSHLPAVKQWAKGLSFIALFLVAVQIPSVFGVIVFEKGNEWDFFTPGRIANYVVLLDDVLVFLLTGVLMGLLFGGSRTIRHGRSSGLALATGVCLLVFPVTLMASVHGVFHLLSMAGPVDGSLWQNTVFYGVFALTGLCLPMFHVLVKRSRGAGARRPALYTTLLFCLLWLPVQNFMFVFGWEVVGPLIFSVASLVPISLTVFISDRLIKEEHND